MATIAHIPSEVSTHCMAFLPLGDIRAFSEASKACAAVVKDFTGLTCDLNLFTKFSPQSYIGRVYHSMIRDGRKTKSDLTIIRVVGRVVAAYIEMHKNKLRDLEERGDEAYGDDLAARISGAPPSSQPPSKQSIALAFDICTHLLVRDAEAIFRGTTLQLHATDSTTRKAEVVTGWLLNHRDEITLDLLKSAAVHQNSDVAQAILDIRQFSSRELFSALIASENNLLTAETILNCRPRDNISPTHLGYAWLYAARAGHTHTKLAIEKSGRPFNKNRMRMQRAWDIGSAIPLGIISYGVIGVSSIPGVIGYGAQEAYFVARRVFEMCRRPHEE